MPGVSGDGRGGPVGTGSGGVFTGSPAREAPSSPGGAPVACVRRWGAEEVGPRPASAGLALTACLRLSGGPGLKVGALAAGGLARPFGTQQGLVCTRTRRVPPQQASVLSLQLQAWQLGTIGWLLSKAQLRAAGYLKQGRNAS